MEEVEVKTETGNQKGKESQKEQPKSILDYDQGFRPEYRNRVKTVNVPGTVQEIPEDIVARNDEESVQKAGESEEQKKAEAPEKVKKPEKEKPEEISDSEYQSYGFKIGMQTDTWNQVTKLLNTIRSEARFIFVKEGINVRVVDPAHVGMLDITIPDEALVDREAQEGTLFALDVAGMPKFKNGGIFYMSRKESRKPLEIEILYDGIVQTVMELDVNTVTYPRIPMIKYADDSAVATVKTDPLRKFIAAARDISDAVTFTAHREDMVIISAKSDTRKGEIVLDRDNNGGLLDYRMDRKETAIKSHYPLEYIGRTVKATIATEMEISWKTDYPMTARFKLPQTVRKNRGYYPPGTIPAIFLLAPRMEQ